MFWDKVALALVVNLVLGGFFMPECWQIRINLGKSYMVGHLIYRRKSNSSF